MKLIKILLPILVLGLSLHAFGQTPDQTTPKVDQTTALDADSTVGPPEHPATEDQIREYMSLTGLSRVTHTLLAKTVDAERASAAPYFPASYWADLADEFSDIDVVALYLPIYQKYLSTEDMAAIISFYRSPAGKRILATQRPIVADVTPIMRKVGEDIGKRVYGKHKDEIEAAKARYETGASTASSTKKK